MNPTPNRSRFQFRTAEYELVATGIKKQIKLKHWTGKNVAERITETLAKEPQNPIHPPIVVGAIPFNPEHPAHLYIPETFTWNKNHATARTSTTPTQQTSKQQLHYNTENPNYKTSVEKTVKLLKKGHAEKIVLARTLHVNSETPYKTAQIIDRLQTANPTAYTFLIDLPQKSRYALLHDATCFLGASPELLLASSNNRVTTFPLAGSAPRHSNPHKDLQNGENLLHSRKNLHEHALVTQMVIDTFKKYCVPETVTAPPQPGLVQTPVIWHLGTPIAGQLRPGTSPLELLYHLHPTPAVCGWPTNKAKQALPKLEKFERGLFAGVIGWIDATGNSEWAIALRSGTIKNKHATLYAGAGIVTASNPTIEHEETTTKLRTLLNAL